MNRPLSSLEDAAAGGPSAPSAGTSAGVAGLDLDVLMARLREEVEARKRQAAHEAPAPAAPAAARAAPAGPTPVAEPRRVRAEDLLELPEAAFVMTAYRLLLDREASPEEADSQIDRLLLGQVGRAEWLAGMVGSEEAARANGAILEGLPQARRRERMMSSPITRLVLKAAHAFRTVYLLPKRVRQFVKRVEALEQRASEGGRGTETRIETLEQEVLSLQQEVLSLRAAVHADVAQSPAEAKRAARPASPSARRRSDAR